MARKLVAFALLLFAVVGLASAAAKAPAASPSEDNAGSGAVGNIGGGEETDAAPVGGPVPDGTFSSVPGATAPSPASGAAKVEVSAVAGVATAAVAAVFF